jgi:MFS family permease
MRIPAGLAMQIGGRLADALGAREITLAALPLLIAGMITIGLADNFAIAIIGVVLIGLGNGAMDVSMNAIGVQVEAARQRPIMSFFHAFWSIGTFIGAGAVLLLAALLGLHGAAIVTPVSIFVAVATASRSACFQDTQGCRRAPHGRRGEDPIPKAA